jgi:hypothetical protein
MRDWPKSQGDPAKAGMISRSGIALREILHDDSNAQSGCASCQHCIAEVAL